MLGPLPTSARSSEGGPLLPCPTFHPILAGREGEMFGLAESLRSLIDRAVTSAAPPEALTDAISRIDAISDLLGSFVPDTPIPRFVDPAGVGETEGTGETAGVGETEGTGAKAGVGETDGQPFSGTIMHGAMPYDPVVGQFNPIALPVTIAFDPPLAIGTAHFTTAYEGGPGWVHGGVIASTFDIVLTAANQIAGTSGPTVCLTVRYLRPTLIGIESRFEAEVVAKDERRVISRGKLIQEGHTCCEAEGEFAVIPAHRLRTRRP